MKYQRTDAAMEGAHDAELLAACYRSSLALAVEHSLRTVAFPSISTGAYRYPREEAAIISSEAIENFLKSDDTLEEVRLVFYLQRDAKVFLKNHQFRGEKSYRIPRAWYQL